MTTVKLEIILIIGGEKTELYGYREHKYSSECAMDLSAIRDKTVHQSRSSRSLWGMAKRLLDEGGQEIWMTDSCFGIICKS